MLMNCIYKHKIDKEKDVKSVELSIQYYEIGII